MNDDLCFLPAFELASGIRRKVFSPVEVVEAFLSRIVAHNGRVNAYVTVTGDDARSRAQEAEKKIMRGEVDGPLHGVPVAIKDLNHKAGVPTSFGSNFLKGYLPAKSGLTVQRLENAGAIVLGKTNTPEFGAKPVTDNIAFGPTSTPFALGKNAGGSSGGSAAAVAAGLAALAPGGDAGGSIRIPASFCGIFGMMPTFGRIPYIERPNAFEGHTPFSNLGPMTRTVYDAALMMEVLSDHHPRDPFSASGSKLQYCSAIGEPIDDLKIAYSPDFGIFPLEASVRSVVETALQSLAPLVKALETPDFSLSLSLEELLKLHTKQNSVANALTVAGFETDGFDLTTQRWLDVDADFRNSASEGAAVSALEYRMLDVARTRIFDQFEDLFETFDVIITPTVGVLPFSNSDRGKTTGPSMTSGPGIAEGRGWFMTSPVNLTGHPAASAPAGFTEDGMPVGLQIIGRRFAERTIFALSSALERAKPWDWAYRSLISF